MKENITTRVGRIISGSVNTLIDAIENSVPETVMEESIREIDSAINEVRVELGKVVANKHLATTRLAEENRKHNDLSEKIELAINDGRDDLAEVAIATQFDIEAQIPILKTTITDCENQEKELEGYISALQAKKREMQNELKQFRISQQHAESTSATNKPSTVTANNIEKQVEKAGSAFDRVMENATGLSSQSNSIDRTSAVQLAELDEMARKNRIQERLASLKGNNENVPS